MSGVIVIDDWHDLPANLGEHDDGVQYKCTSNSWTYTWCASETCYTITTPPIDW